MNVLGSMKNKLLILVIATAVSFIQTCVFLINDPKISRNNITPNYDTVLITTDVSAAIKPKDSLALDSSKSLGLSHGSINTRNISPKDVVVFAQTLFGTPYLYASTDPAKGFDCSGFVTYVFMHFNIIVPRSSIDFTNVGTEVKAVDSKPGDIILFTGTDSLERFVGHMGIIISNQSNDLQFIHSSSGKAGGVTISPLSGYYQSRFVKVVRIFPQNY